MFGKVPGLRASILQRMLLVAHCDGSESSDNAAEEVSSLIADADRAIEEQKAKVRTPPQYENVQHLMRQGQVNGFDGFRVAVQKQINLQTVVSHFYWLGSQVTGQPIYQYRVILPIDDKLINVATDMDMNLEAELKVPLSSNFTAKFNGTLGDREPPNGQLDLDYQDDSSTGQIQYDKGPQTALKFAYMQMLNPYLTLGGMGKYNLEKDTWRRSVAGMYERNDQLVALTWDADSSMKALYVNKVNPNRVHLSTELGKDAQGNISSGVGAEFTLKASKVHVSTDQNLNIKSSLNVTLGPGQELLFSAEIGQLSGESKFGFGIQMG